jgi:hypothetical protein
MVKESEILALAMTFIDTPEKWCQRKPVAYRENGLARCGGEALNIAAFCLDGFELQSMRRLYARVVAALEELCPEIERGHGGIVPYNDAISMDQPTMYAAFEKARNAALEEGN